MPEMDGVEATRHIVAAGGPTRIVVLTSFGDESRILDALNAGAHGYLLKHVAPDDLINAVRAADGGRRTARPPCRARAARLAACPVPRQDELTDRELEVLRLVAEGMANKQIARKLGISERTVKAHLTSVFQRLGVSDRVQAALWAQQHLPLPVAACGTPDAVVVARWRVR